MSEPGASAYFPYWSTQDIFHGGGGVHCSFQTSTELPSLSSLLSLKLRVCSGVELREQSTNRKSIDWARHSLLL